MLGHLKALWRSTRGTTVRDDHARRRHIVRAELSAEAYWRKIVGLFFARDPAIVGAHACST